jgi:hypothetical protein
MIGFTTGVPLDEAVESISRRTPMGTVLSSAEWDLVPAEIRLRSFWAARLECEKLAAEMHRRLAQRIALERSKLADGKEGVTMDRRRFIDEMRQEFKKAGYRPEAGKEGTLQDFTSERRLGLIWDMNLAQAEGYAQWKTAMDPDILRATPAWEFKRLESRMERRNWPAIWRANGGRFYPGPSEYPEGRMLALKTAEIWVKINRFGVPWKPFDWGSGMGTRNVRRKECLELGLLKPGEVQTPSEVPFNQGAEASLKGIPESRRRVIEDEFRGDVEIEGDVIRLLPLDEISQGRPGKVARPIFRPRDQPAANQNGTDLTEVVIVPGGLVDRAIRKEATRAIKVAAGVHTDGVLPKPDVSITSPGPGVGGDYRLTTDGNTAPQIRISPSTLDAGWAALHELAHLLDNHGLHTPTMEHPYASTGQKELAALMSAITRSKTYTRLLTRCRAGKKGYWVAPQELFARAYSQFIATKSGDAQLLAELNKIRSGERESYHVWSEAQWPDDDFAPILLEMEKLFTDRGWIPLPQ